MVEKIKNLFVVTLDDGRQTYFDFADGNIYGVSGKIVQNFNAEAKRILKSEQNDDFLAMYFYERTLTCPYRDTLKKWPTSLVETMRRLPSTCLRLCSRLTPIFGKWQIVWNNFPDYFHAFAC